MLSISQAKDIRSIVNELRSKGFSKLDIYLILRTLKPDAKLEYLLSPGELDIVNRVNGLRIELYRMRTELYDLEKKVRRRHELIMGVYEELMKSMAK
ncbi:hypothetical protein [Vulcanisaeta distributa]|uniref:Uncharacterized protein n=1 Tax=Vulcanisaeta distributa (strain DSM 14429 / JCM 11212 / NBRC 100878 / IC-017) TaxID=572478 RepID=E1QR23_VULDI|nr:hypothetical protein [Vulcanisaeta distributa]ADN51713.1 hypothetical protein Vdis_2345 [Vulcanisaeta distributa DSM 14429]